MWLASATWLVFIVCGPGFSKRTVRYNLLEQLQLICEGNLFLIFTKQVKRSQLHNNNATPEAMANKTRNYWYPVYLPDYLYSRRSGTWHLILKVTDWLTDWLTHWQSRSVSPWVPWVSTLINGNLGVPILPIHQTQGVWCIGSIAYFRHLNSWLI